MITQNTTKDNMEFNNSNIDSQLEKYIQKAIEYYSNNDVTLKECQEKFGIRSAILSKKFKERGITIKRHNYIPPKKDISNAINYFSENPDCPYKTCAKMFNISVATLKKGLKENNLYTSRKRVYSPKELESINKSIEYYKENSLSTVAECSKIFNIPTHKILSELKKQNIQIHEQYKSVTKEGLEYLTHYGNKNNTYKKVKNTTDEDFFEHIDTEEKAYWLGFILADGSLSDSNDLSIGLSIRDYDHLHRFKKAIKATNKIYEYKTYVKKMKMYYMTCDISIRSLKISTDLKKHNIFPRKSTHEKPDLSIGDNLIHHYIRGFFDGDGWFSTYERKSFYNKWECGFGSSEEMLLYIQKKCKDLADINFSTPKPFSSFYKIELTNQIEIMKFINFIYKDATVYLPRKYERASLLCQLHSKTIEE